MAINWLNLGSTIGGLIDDLHTSDEERQKLNNELIQIENSYNSKLLQTQQALLAAQTQIITAEAQGHSWLQRNWRPITMLTFLILITADCLGWLEYRLSEQAWDLLKLGLGGYVIGRSVEKAIPAVGQVVDKVKGKPNGHR
ncbi:3TM-type holin [Pseudoalteromonas sp. S16_S37]|uniref:3TM-type holin n=1 Tax=Pseudoalteromonas sp. S16_S37 TaxID=2720228 RepID=UPI001680BFE6|nr:3TM-type holin [Pseudoalteromonas sp. S16_S37]MBD1584921.1 hypothetical protein [Pseudoalteromonas sp. S16_S37]